MAVQVKAAEKKALQGEMVEPEATKVIGSVELHSEVVEAINSKDNHGELFWCIF